MNPPPLSTPTPFLPPPQQSFSDSECLNTAVKITGLFGGTVGDEEAELLVVGGVGVMVLGGVGGGKTQSRALADQCQLLTGPQLQEM